MKKIILTFFLFLITQNAFAEYRSYQFDVNRYDIDNSTKETIDNIDYIVVPVENSGFKKITLKYINNAIEKCMSVENFDQKTRYNFWIEVKAKAVSIGAN